MLSSVLRSQRAIKVNIEIMRAFIRLRQMLTILAVLIFVGYKVFVSLRRS